MTIRATIALLLLCGLSPVALNAASPAPLIALSVQTTQPNVTKARSAEIRISLRNISKHNVVVLGRLEPGNTVQLYALDKSGNPFQLIYPEGSIPPADKKDFVTLAPGKAITKPIHVSWSMMPGMIRQSGWLKLAVRVTIGDPGERFGLNGWTGSLKSYVRLHVTKKPLAHHA